MPNPFDIAEGKIKNQNPFDIAESNLNIAGPENIRRSSFLTPPSGETFLSQDRPIRKTASDLYTPTLKGLGFAGGAMAGAPGGLVTSTIGAGAGTAAMGNIARRLDELTGLRKPQDFAGSMGQAVSEFAEGSIGELFFAGLNKFMGAATEVPEYIAKKISSVITKGIEKGIRPTVVGRQTSALSEAYMNKAESGVKSIIANKDNLQLTDQAGNTTQGLPKSLKQFGEAIEQTRIKIFEKYDAMKMAAGEKGAIVDLSQVIRELESVAGDDVTASMSPKAAAYARGMARRLSKKGTFTTKEAQDAIAQINTRLASYYRNRPYDYANQSTIDNLVATNLRKSLDDVIETATGQPGYQTLKNEYGALKTIEKDVNHRANIDARKNNIGFFGYADIWTAAEAINALSNPSSLMKIAAIQGSKKAINFINNPNRIIKSMFGDAEKLISKLPKETQQQVIKALIPESEPGVYRYQPEFKGTKSAAPSRLQTELQPGEAGTPTNLFPDQQARQMGIKTEGTLLGPEPVIPSPLTQPDKSQIKSVIPEQINVDIVKREIPKVTKQIEEAAILGKLKIPYDYSEWEKMKATKQINMFRKRHGLPPLKGTPVETVKGRRTARTLEKINEFRKKKGLPPISEKAKGVFRASVIIGGLSLYEILENGDILFDPKGWADTFGRNQ